VCLIRTRICRRRTLIVALWLGYLVFAAGYLYLVEHKSGVWQTKRQKLIEESPVVWVAPYGIHYHQQKHYGRHLSAPLSLYEATEQGYLYCNFCHPPPPAQLLHLPVWARHWLVILLAASCSWLVLTLVVLYKTRGRIDQAVAADARKAA
jgi:hypothetical protein